MKLGSAMSCNEGAFLEAINSLQEVNLLHYLEVGCAWGYTAGGMAEQLFATRGDQWKGIAIDKADGGWHYDKQQFINRLGMFYGGNIEPPEHLFDKANGFVYFNGSGSEEFLKDCKDQFDFVLIDACHSEECCTRDFQLVDPLVKLGGFVFFHDADPQAQGKDVQPHCGKTIGVREALKKLRLLGGNHPLYTTFSDIQPVEEYERGCFIVRKTATKDNITP